MAAFINRETALAIRRGAAGAAPIVMGYIPIGFAFGVLAAEAGIDLVGAAAMSVFVFAGSAQFIAIGLMASGCSIAALGMTVFLVNLRHFLMSAALAPYLGRFKRWQQVLFCFELTDESFAVHSADLRTRAAPVLARMIALNLCAHISWTGSTLVGKYVLIKVVSPHRNG